MIFYVTFCRFKIDHNICTVLPRIPAFYFILRTRHSVVLSFFLYCGQMSNLLLDLSAETV